MAPFGQAETQAPQAAQASPIAAPSSLSWRAPGTGQTAAHCWHCNLLQRKRVHSWSTTRTGSSGRIATASPMILADTDPLPLLAAGVLRTRLGPRPGDDID